MRFKFLTKKKPKKKGDDGCKECKDDEDVKKNSSGQGYVHCKPDTDATVHVCQVGCWLIDCSRDMAESMLRDRVDGTFLVRKSSQPGQHALSVVCDGQVFHCLIYERHGKFGFAAPFVHNDLLSLVLHYTSSSLEKHNEKLKTSLKYCALFSRAEENVYEE